MLQEAVDAVQAFHKCKNIDIKQRLTELAPRSDSPQLLTIMREHSEACLRQYQSFLTSPEGIKDTRLLRIHLILEEVAETISAILACDEAEVLDGICDSIYVLVGTAICFDLPLDAAFREVQRANMDKTASKGEDNPRLKDKGEGWQPPRIADLIMLSRIETPRSTSLPETT